MWGVLNGQKLGLRFGHVFKCAFLVTQVLRQLNVEGFKDVEVSGKKILIPGGYILLQNQKSQVRRRRL